MTAFGGRPDSSEEPLRRIAAALITFLALTATLLVLPVYAAPVPEAEPVETASDAVAMGSVEDPAAGADVQEGTTDPVSGVPESAPTLTVSRPETDPFSLVGITWSYDTAVTDTVVQVRVKDDDGTWGGWTEVAQETLDQTSTPEDGTDLRGGTSPLWTGSSDGVEVELVTRTGAQPTDVQLDLVDPGTSAADDSLTSPAITDTANADSSMPAVYSRAQWGADESIRTWDPEYAPTTKAATLHHTADTNNYSKADVPAIMRSIYRYHTVSLGWGDIGYNVIVDKFGRLWEGRYGGLASTVVGAHAAGFNTSTFGVSMLGNYDITAVPQKTVDAVAAIIAWKFSLYGVDPRGTTVLTSDGKYGTSRYAKGVKVTLPTIFGHRDVGSTVCPGRYGYARLPEIRTLVAAKMKHLSNPVTTRYEASAALQKKLGAATTSVLSTSGGTGLYQNFANGSIYWSALTDARYVLTDVRTKFLASGGVTGKLGFPTGDTTCSASGCSQVFTSGSMFWSKATGAHVTQGKIAAKYAALGAQGSALGYPTNDVTCGLVRSGCWQKFTGGRIYYQKSAGTHVLSGLVLAQYKAQTYQKGALGYPTSDVTVTAGKKATFADFEGGSVYAMASGTVWKLSPSVVTAWSATGRSSGPLGYPTAVAARAADGAGKFQQFEKGAVYWSAATGWHAIGGALYTAWSAAGGVSSSLGYPTTNVLSYKSGLSASFAGGHLAWTTAGGAHQVSGGAYTAWSATGGVKGPLGYPVQDATSTTSGVRQTFQSGVVYATSRGTYAVGGPVYTKWVDSGGSSGSLGVPTSNLVTANGGQYATFAHGAVTYSSTTAAHRMAGVVAKKWLAVGGPGSPLGYPTTDQRRTPDGTGVYVHFRGGSIYSTTATGAHWVGSAIEAKWKALRWERGTLGYPTSDQRKVSGGSKVIFQHGSITYETRTKKYTVATR